MNRDLSIAILRQFIKLRKAELAEGKLKLKPQRKGAPRPTENGTDVPVTDHSKVRILEGLAASFGARCSAEVETESWLATPGSKRIDPTYYRLNYVVRAAANMIHSLLVLMHFGWWSPSGLIGTFPGCNEISLFEK